MTTEPNKRLEIIRKNPAIRRQISKHGKKLYQLLDLVDQMGEEEEKKQRQED